VSVRDDEMVGEMVDDGDGDDEWIDNMRLISSYHLSFNLLPFSYHQKSPNHIKSIKSNKINKNLIIKIEMRENGMSVMRWMIYHLIMIGFFER